MGKPLTNEKIYEQYVDAAAAFFMDQYALTLQEELETEPKTEVEIPKALDEKCRRLIRKGVARRHRRQLAGKLLHAGRAAALAIVTLFGIAAILFTTVKAVRMPILNFFIRQKDGYLEITDPDQLTPERIAANAARFRRQAEQLGKLIPSDYTQDLNECNSFGGILMTFVDAQNHRILFSANLSGTTHFDTEDAASIEEVRIGAREGLLVEKNGYRLLWRDAENGIVYLLTADGLSREEVLTLANRIEAVQ